MKPFSTTTFAVTGDVVPFVFVLALSLHQFKRIARIVIVAVSTCCIVAGCSDNANSAPAADGAANTAAPGAPGLVGSPATSSAPSGSRPSPQTATSLSPASTLAMTCSPASAPSPALATGDLIAADTPGSDGTRMFGVNKPFKLAFTTRAKSSDTLSWQIADAWSTVHASGRIAVVPGANVWTLNCTSALAGYFSVSATLAAQGGTLMARGTRPNGIASFGILPDVSPLLPALGEVRQDLPRFGGQGAAYLLPGQDCCSGDGYRPLYKDLGLAWVNDNRNWYLMEPNGPNTFDPSADHVASFFKQPGLLRLIQLDGIPAWASPTHEITHSYAPTSLSAYQSFMSKVGQESSAVRARYFPNQTNNYYQVTWEPDYGGGLPWRDTDAHFVDMYKATWQGIHATDPHAVVMGVTNAVMGTNAVWLKRLAPLGIGQYLDGVTAHGYYDAGTSPSHPPERLADDPDPAAAANALPASTRALRHAMAAYLKPGAKLFVTETGTSYDIGTSYGPNYPSANVLYAQGAVAVRTHLILLGEGADLTYVFYMSDIPPPGGYGIFFDLEHPQGGFGPHDISPKPAALAVAAMTRIIDATITLGPIRGTPKGVYAYAFQKTDGGKVISALWTHNNAVWSSSSGFSATYSVPYSLQVDAPGTSGTVSVLDMMGNASNVAYANGRVSLALTEAPIYVIANDAALAKANATTPEGYVGP